MKLLSNHTLLLAGLLAIVGCAGTRREVSMDDFVKVSGTRFIQNGRPYYFAGTNLWYGFYLGAPGPTGDRERLERELDTLQAMGITNLRILAGSEASAIERTLRPAVQTAPGVLDEELLVGLDFLLAAMGKRGMTAVVFLSNYWEWSGGFAQYVAWAEGKNMGVDPWDPAQGWGKFMNYSALLYTNDRAKAMYREYARAIVMRTNTITGLPYREDPTIMSWQLANEPRPGTNDEQGMANMPAFIAWIDSTARFIKSMDPNHLVCAGSEGTVGTLQNAEQFLNTYRTPAIDYLNFHVWPYNWGWFDPYKASETVTTAEVKATEYIHEQLELARRLGKPVTMEEFGLARDSLRSASGSPVTARNRYFRTILSLIADSAEAGSPIAGTNFWSWGGEGVARHADFQWRPGDPFTGDPPHEAQGLNSIFNEDEETKQILREHAERMRALRAR